MNLGTSVSETHRGLADVKIHLVDDMDTANAAKRWLSTTRHVAVDTETTGLNPRRDRVRLLQLGDTRQSYVIPIDNPGWGALGAELLTRYPGEFDAHNLTFDAKQIKNTLGVSLPEHRCHDTRLMAHVLESTGSLTLKGLSTRLVDSRAAGMQQALKEGMESAGWNWETVPIDYEPYWVYGGLDTILTSQVREILAPKVMNEAPESYELELAVSWVCSRMEDNGVLIDREYIQQFRENLFEYVKKADTWCRSQYRVSPGSNNEVVRALRRDGVVFTQFTAKTGAVQLNEEVLQAIDHPLARVVLQRRKADKLVSTYLDNYLHMAESDGRIYPSINTVGGRGRDQFEPGGVSGVRTSRMSMSDPNFQNVPTRSELGKRIRRAFRPSEDHVWMKSDADQIELRILAHISGDVRMRESFSSGEDFFVETGRRMFHDPGFSKGDPRRSFIKSGIYGKVYGAGVETFSSTVGLPEDEGQAFMKSLDNLYPGVPRWIQKTAQLMKQRLKSEGMAYIRSFMTGRRIVVEPGKLYAGANFAIQGPAAEIMKLTILRAEAAGIAKYIMFPVHDELDLDVPHAEAAEVRQILDKVTNDYDTLSVPLTWSAETGPNWGDCAA